MGLDLDLLYPTSRLMFVIFLDLVSISHMFSYILVHLSFPYYALVVGFDSPCMLSSKMYSRLSSLFHYWADPSLPCTISCTLLQKFHVVFSKFPL